MEPPSFLLSVAEPLCRVGDQLRLLTQLPVPGVPQLVACLAASSVAETQAVQALVDSLSSHLAPLPEFPGVHGHLLRCLVNSLRCT
jgi:hypothetical protein